MQKLVIACVLALSSAAHAQPHFIGEITLDWSFVEVYAGTNTPVANPNGMIEPGEAARVELSVSYDPPFGTLVPYTAPPGPGIGSIAALASISVDLEGTTPGWEGLWTDFTRRPGWALGSTGSHNPGSNGVWALNAGQFPMGSTVANPLNPVNAIWTGIWTPDDYTHRSTVFQSRGQYFHRGVTLYILYGNDPITGHPLYISTYSTPRHGSVAIPVVPAPGTAAAMFAMAMLTARRRRPMYR